MPIKGLSDRDSVDPRFKEIGRLRKGAPKSGNRVGADLEYFRFVPDGDRADVLRAFYDAYGKEPTHLQVFFPFDTMERNFSSWREAYGQNRICKLRCDGERWRDWVEGDRHYHSRDGQECTFDYRDSENECPKCPCAFAGRLSIILPDLWYAGFVGLVTVITSSKNDIATIASKLTQYEPLTGRPFVLWREPERVGVPINGKRAAKDMSLLHLELTEERLLLEFNAARERSRAQLVANVPNDEPVVDMPGDDPPDLDYDGELIEGDEFLAGDYRGASPTPETREVLREEAERDSAVEAQRDAETELPPFLVPPPENDWTTFFRRCIDELGYENPAQAAKIKDQVWLQDPRPSWDDLWTHMVEVQAEKGHIG